MAALALATTAWAQEPVRIGYAIARTGPWAPGAQVTQEPSYILWAEVNAAHGLDVKACVELIG
jgi:branched-chain amino acid transport system substrate-binding protein